MVQTEQICKATLTDRVAAANQVLACLTRDTYLEVERGRVFVNWCGYHGQEMRRQWMTRGGQDFYPVWHNKWGHGGTASTALSQLVRWIQGKPVLPMASWEYWDKIGLGRERGGEAILILRSSGYPQKVPCVLCGETLGSVFDWWNLDGVSGPCCDWNSGCRQLRHASDAALRSSLHSRQV